MRCFSEKKKYNLVENLIANIVPQRITGLSSNKASPALRSWFNLLLQVPGMSTTKSLSIIESFPTVSSLFKALHRKSKSEAVTFLEVF